MESIGIAEVAALAGVSPATVSRALRGIPGVAAATRSSVHAAAEQLGYVPSPSASSLSTGRAGAIGVVAPWLSRWFFATAIEGVQRTVLENKHDLLLYLSHLGLGGGHQPIDLRSMRKRVDGVIAINVPVSAEQFTDFRVPVVTIGGHYPGVSAVSVDDQCVGRMATEHLLSLGHRTIAFLGEDPDRIYGFCAASDRLAGYRASLSDAAIEIESSLIETTGFSVNGGEIAFRRLWAGVQAGRIPCPTAIFAVSDEVAMGVVDAARRLGLRVPDDLSVIGVDNHDLSYLFDLTTVSQPVRRQGRLAAEMLLQVMADPLLPRTHTFVDPTLIIRGTTGRPRTDLVSR